MKGFRGAFLDFIGDPFYLSELESVRYFPDGLLVIENGIIQALGNYVDICAIYPNISVTHYRDRLILPGFIDTHIHFPQTEMISAYGEQLLEWLNKYTFPTERKFKEKTYAKKIAAFCLDELLKNGTTTALVLTTVFPESTDAFFEEARDRNLRMIAGKVMMDRNAPDYLKDTAKSSYEETKNLIHKWHQNDRLLYAVTPRFAATSTEEQLQLAGQLLQEFPDVYLHTHLSENVKEVAWIKELFPHCTNYLDVYDRAGLVCDRSIFAHGIQLSEAEFKRLSEANSTISFCPTSNLFLGSGLFKLNRAKSPEEPIKVGLGTDVGAGTSFSLLQTANEGYKVSQLQGHKLSPFQALFLVTLGGARALNLEEKIGNFDKGKEADFIVINLQAMPLLALRNRGEIPKTVEEIGDRIFALMMLGDDRAISETYILGDRVSPSVSSTPNTIQ
ncbi:MAG: guanine deaminase [Cyanobacteria bacterium SBLK]|nr:guanine deaminase [Cyanobacteria bacterium SBLK]